MKTFLISLFAVFLSFGFVAQEAEAKRMGGGKSFGMQRSAPAKQNAVPTPQRQSSATPAQAGPQKRSWMGPIAGLAAGLGLAALASHLGFGEEMANFLMLALLAMVAFIAIRWFMRKNAPQTPAMQYAGHAQNLAPAHFDAQPSAPASSSHPGMAYHNAQSFPPGFDADAFAREAKINFIRLQTAFDSGNLDDLRSFTTPEVFAELSMQIAERAGAQQHTEVLHVDAQVLEALEEQGQQIVSVQFDADVREEAGQTSNQVVEVWHLTRPADGRSGWRVAGVQQR